MVKQILKKIAKVEPIVESPTGSIDKKGVKHAAGAGLAVAPVGAYTGEVVDLIYKGVESLPGFIQVIMKLSFAENIIGGLTGFLVASITAAAWKFMRHYE